MGHRAHSPNPGMALHILGTLLGEQCAMYALNPGGDETGRRAEEQSIRGGHERIHSTGP